MGGKASPKATWIYDIPLGTWSQGPELPGDTVGDSARVIGDQIVVWSSPSQAVFGLKNGIWTRWDGILEPGDLLSKAGVVVEDPFILGVDCNPSQDWGY